MPEKEDSTEKKECCSGGCNSNSSSRSNSCVCSQNNSNSSNSGNNVEFLKERCGSLFTCFDGEPQRMQGFSAFESPPPRAVGSLGDSTLFGADSEAAAAAAAASAAAAAAAGAAAAAAAAATPGAGCSGEGSSDNTVPMSEKYRQQFEEVRHLLKSRCLFTEKTVDKHLLEYYNHLGLNEFYFRTAKPSSIADNLQAVIAARALHAVSGTEYFPEIQQIDERTGEVFALSKASLTAKRAAQNYKTERKLEQLFLNMGREENKQQMRMQCYRSTQSVFGIDANFERLRTYFFQKPDFPYREEELSPTEKDISKLLDVNFFASKKNTVTASIFQRLNEQLVGDSTGLALFVNVVPRDLAFRRGPHTEEFFSRFGDCLTMWGFYSQRKYVEPLANGSSIITTFVELLPEGILVFPSMPIQERIDNLLSAVRLQFVMAKSKYADFARTLNSS
ncbi:NAD-specific glutamate dehydrogenase, related [Eimeria acervulina]|uniref:NAD-specific glutamate dehydrogenase, related n=1 Tax=Eimeria acervulina TaxID=5801 RepID=U6GJW1_EIMAC|nr:NAD-specific glutamate dehydrogenase, related [Eimeria acervulina]CDI79872.1 NAD-specific glutamate dehydrogenase, related [Eimeria acervulina]